jgi:hypothetical protein
VRRDLPAAIADQKKRRRERTCRAAAEVPETEPRSVRERGEEGSERAAHAAEAPDVETRVFGKRGEEGSERAAHAAEAPDVETRVFGKRGEEGSRTLGP